MFGTAALLFGWTLLEELPKNPPPPPKEETTTTTTTIIPRFPFGPVDTVTDLGAAQRGVYTPDNAGIFLRAPPPNQFETGILRKGVVQ